MMKSPEEQTIDNFMKEVLSFLKKHKCKSINRIIEMDYVSIEYRKINRGKK